MALSCYTGLFSFPFLCRFWVSKRRIPKLTPMGPGNLVGETGGLGNPAPTANSLTADGFRRKPTAIPYFSNLPNALIVSPEQTHTLSSG